MISRNRRNRRMVQLERLEDRIALSTVSPMHHPLDDHGHHRPAAVVQKMHKVDDHGVDPAGHDAKDNKGMHMAVARANDNHGVHPANHNAHDNKGHDKLPHR